MQYKVMEGEEVVNQQLLKMYFLFFLKNRSFQINKGSNQCPYDWLTEDWTWITVSHLQLLVTPPYGLSFSETMEFC